jgi:hypothetical protein
VTETKVPAAKPVAPAKAPVAEAAKPAAPDVFPRMETGPSRKSFHAAAPNSAKGLGGNSVITNSTYLWVGRFEREEKAQSAAKKIEAMLLPAYIATRTFGAVKYYAVFCGPVDVKRVSGVTERLEAKGFSNVHQVNNPMGAFKQRE